MIKNFHKKMKINTLDCLLVWAFKQRLRQLVYAYTENVKYNYPAPETLWWLTDPPVLTGPNPDNMRVYSTGNTILHLGI